MSLVNLLIATRDSFAGWRRKHRAYEELMALDNHMLADIGINRSEISRIVWGSHEEDEASFEEERRQREFIDDTPSVRPSFLSIPRPF